MFKSATDADFSPKGIAENCPIAKNPINIPQLWKYQDSANPMRTKAANIAIYFSSFFMS